MYTATFIRLIEEEYYEVLNLSLEYEKKYGFSLFEKPAAICELVQKFKNWLIMAIRSAEVSEKGEWVKPEDAIIKAATVKVESNKDKLLHPGLNEALQLLDRYEFDALFGDTRRLIFEKSAGENVTECKFKVCYSHCKFVKDYVNPVNENTSSMPDFSRDWPEDTSGTPA